MGDYDVVIVGAGPAGSTAGYILTGYGLRVVIIDRERFPRRKPCSGCLTDKTIHLLKRIYGESIEEMKRDDLLEYKSSVYEIRFKERVLLKKTAPRSFYFVDRTAYDDFLLKKAEGIGAEVIEGDEVVSYNLLMNEIKTSSGRRIRGKVIIGADGVNSVIRRTFLRGPLEGDTWGKNMTTALQISLPRSDIKTEIQHPVIILGFIDYGYSWVFPNRDKILIGSCGLNIFNRKRFRHLFNDLLSFLNIGLDDMRIDAHPLQCGGFLKRPVFGNTLLIGDAAGFVDPILGEGIYYAQRTAEIAGDAIYRALKDGKNLEETYSGLLQQTLFPHLLYGLRLRNLVFKYLKGFHFTPLKLLFKVFGDMPVEAVHGMRTYRWFMRNHPDSIV